MNETKDLQNAWQALAQILQKDAPFEEVHEAVKHYCAVWDRIHVPEIRAQYQKALKKTVPHE